MDIIKIDELRKVYRVDVFDKELKKLFNKSLNEYLEYTKYLLGRLRFLEECDYHPTKAPYEHLKVNGYDLYRIASKSHKKNVRVIYFYKENDDIVLLAAFEEKNKSDYNNNINNAINRLKDIRKGQKQ